MIRLFTVVSPARSGTKWYSRLFTTERSFCFHELTSLYRPYPINVVGESSHSGTHLHHGHDFELAQRRVLLEAFPEYFTRLWCESRIVFVDPMKCEPSDERATRSLPIVRSHLPSV